jgi:hypothetical protein
MAHARGKHTWLIADCYWPEITAPGHYLSHESICVLNTGDDDAHIRITLYFEDREPMNTFNAACAARRTHHIRMDKLRDSGGHAVPIGVPYAALLVSSAPIVVQYSRIDTTQPNETFATTMAFPID